MEEDTSLITLRGHTGNIFSLYSIDKHRVLSSSLDRSIRIWHLNDLSIQTYLEGQRKFFHVPTDKISKEEKEISKKVTENATDMDVKDETALDDGFPWLPTSSSEKNKACDSDLISSKSENKGEPVKENLYDVIPNAHKHSILAVICNGEFIISSCYRYIKIWNILPPYDCLATLNKNAEHIDRIECLSLTGQKRIILSGGGPYDKTIKVWYLDVEVKYEFVDETYENDECTAKKMGEVEEVKNNSSKKHPRPSRKVEVKGFCARSMGGHRGGITSLLCKELLNFCPYYSNEDHEEEETEEEISKYKWSQFQNKIDTEKETMIFKSDHNSNTANSANDNSKNCIREETSNDEEGKYVRHFKDNENRDIFQYGQLSSTSSSTPSDSHKNKRVSSTQKRKKNMRRPREYVFSSSSDGSIKVWDLKYGQNLLTLSLHNGSIYSICYLPTMNLIASCSVDMHIRTWDLTKMSSILYGEIEDEESNSGICNRFVYRSYTSGFLSLVTLPNEYFVSGDTNGDLKIWSPSIPGFDACKCVFQAHKESILALSVFEGNLIPKTNPTSNDNTSVGKVDSQLELCNSIKELTISETSSCPKMIENRRVLEEKGVLHYSLISASADSCIKIWPLKFLDKRPLLDHLLQHKSLSVSLSKDTTNKIYEYLPSSELLRLEEVAGRRFPSNPISEKEIRSLSLVELNTTLKKLGVERIPSTNDKNELANLIRTNKTRIII